MTETESLCTQGYEGPAWGGGNTTTTTPPTAIWIRGDPYQNPSGLFAQPGRPSLKCA